MKVTIKVEGARASGKTRLLSAIVYALQSHSGFDVRSYTFAEGERDGSETLTMEVGMTK